MLKLIQVIFIILLNWNNSKIYLVKKYLRMDLVKLLEDNL